MDTLFNGTVIIKEGDITREQVDAIVNAANSGLMGGGGVDGAIHSKGGPSILRECEEIRKNDYPDGLPTGSAVKTGAGNLPAKMIIHTVGPVWKGGTNGEAELLANAYRNSLRAAVEQGAKSIAFPAISTGIYGYPLNEAAKVVYHTLRDWLESNNSIKEIRLVFFSANDKSAFLDSLSV